MIEIVEYKEFLASCIKAPIEEVIRDYYECNKELRTDLESMMIERNALLREIDLLKAELSAVQMMNSIKAKALNKCRGGSMKNRPLMYCINYLEAHDIECYMQGDDVIIYVSDLEITLSKEEVSYRAELWLDSELEGVRV